MLRSGCNGAPNHVVFGILNWRLYQPRSYIGDAPCYMRNVRNIFRSFFDLIIFWPKELILSNKNKWLHCAPPVRSIPRRLQSNVIRKCQQTNKQSKMAKLILNSEWCPSSKKSKESFCCSDTGLSVCHVVTELSCCVTDLWWPNVWCYVRLNKASSWYTAILFIKI